nr:hypothetical protein [Tanacetum cinerariifolium]
MVLLKAYERLGGRNQRGSWCSNKFERGDLSELKRISMLVCCWRVMKHKEADARSLERHLEKIHMTWA